VNPLNDIHKSAAKTLAATILAARQTQTPDSLALNCLSTCSEIALYAIFALIHDPALGDQRADLLTALLSTPPEPPNPQPTIPIPDPPDSTPA